MLNPTERKKLNALLVGGDDRLPIIFNALSDKTRCKMFRLLLKKKRIAVGDMADLLGISMSSASQHLKILEMTNLLKKEREGRHVYFSPQTDDRLVQILIKTIE